jgi:hypothetical protein
MTTYTFTSKQRDGQFFLYRDGEPVGAKYGYATQNDANEAIEQIKRWDRIAG